MTCTPFANTINACVRGRFQGQGQSLPLSRGTIFDMFDIAKKQRYRVDPINCPNLYKRPANFNGLIKYLRCNWLKNRKHKSVR